jgi:two-component system chemotaxis sensor kinase CheA
MAIVAEKVSKLGGKIHVTSIQNQGTTFSISLPVTLATFKGTMIRVGTQLFVVPVSVVERGVRIQASDLKTVEGKSYFFHNQENISVSNLASILGISAVNNRNTGNWFQMVLISWAQKRFAFIVEEIIGEQEGTVKNLGPQLLSVRHLSGAIIMGNGGIVPILNIPEIVETAVESGQKVIMPGKEEDKEVVSHGAKKILVAEDSITLRALLRNIIESDGYQVKTAVDGAEAFLFLQEDDYDLVVSDVEMPRMNGFELTSKIRSDKHRAELPVILVTALDSFEDRQRGMESGANAYIIKGSFEQSNLLDTIKRLI